MQCAKFQIVKVYYISKARCQDVEGLVGPQLVEGIQVSLKKLDFKIQNFYWSNLSFTSMTYWKAT